MLHLSASGKQVFSRLEWALEGKASQDAGLPPAFPSGLICREKTVSISQTAPHMANSWKRQLRLLRVRSEGFLQIHPCNPLCSAGLFHKAGASVFAMFPIQVIPDRRVREGSLWEVQGMPRSGHHCLPRGVPQVPRMYLPFECLRAVALWPQRGFSASRSPGAGGLLARMLQCATQIAQAQLTYVSA